MYLELKEFNLFQTSEWRQKLYLLNMAKAVHGSSATSVHSE